MIRELKVVQIDGDFVDVILLYSFSYCLDDVSIFISSCAILHGRVQDSFLDCEPFDIWYNL